MEISVTQSPSCSLRQQWILPPASMETEGLRTGLWLQHNDFVGLPEHVLERGGAVVWMWNVHSKLHVLRVEIYGMWLDYGSLWLTCSWECGLVWGRITLKGLYLPPWLLPGHHDVSSFSLQLFHHSLCVLELTYHRLKLWGKIDFSCVYGILCLRDKKMTKADSLDPSHP